MIEDLIRAKAKDRLKELEESPEEKGQRLKYSSFYRLVIGGYRAIYESDREEGGGHNLVHRTR